MRRLTMSILKGILVFAVTLIVVITISYTILVYSITNKLNVVANQVYYTVMHNNYLTETAKDTYVDIFEKLLQDYTSSNITVNRSTDGVYINGGLGGSPLDNIVRAISINYSSDLGTGDKLSEVGAYGEGKIVRICVYLRTITFVNQSALASGSYGLKDYESGKVESTRPITIDLVVPCGRYIK